MSILLEISQVLHRLAEVAEVDATLRSHCCTFTALLAALLAGDTEEGAEVASAEAKPCHSSSIKKKVIHAAHNSNIK